MKWILICVVLASCSKAKVMYKYEYSTPKSVEIGVTVSHLGDYERMTDAQLQAERLHQRKLVSINQHDVVLHDTMYVYNY